MRIGGVMASGLFAAMKPRSGIGFNRFEGIASAIEGIARFWTVTDRDPAYPAARQASAERPVTAPTLHP